jgi:hypothetical protein
MGRGEGSGTRESNVEQRRRRWQPEEETYRAACEAVRRLQTYVRALAAGHALVRTVSRGPAGGVSRGWTALSAAVRARVRPSRSRALLPVLVGSFRTLQYWRISHTYAYH